MFTTSANRYTIIIIAEETFGRLIMCTAATYQTDDFYMGRTLDYEFSYGEEITVMPRRFRSSSATAAEQTNTML